MNRSLENQVAVVTGASRGIGRAVALRLARDGALVIGLARREDALKETVRLVVQAGGRMKIHCCDISEADKVGELFDRIWKEDGGIQVLVNNAGVTRDNLLLRMKTEEWDEVLRVNLTGAFVTCRAAMRPMLKQRYGRIINVTSVVGLMGQAGQTNYAASKAGLIGFTKSLAKEVASRNITVNAVAPGFIMTDMTEALAAELKEKALQGIPLQRFGQPEDVAHAVAFLARDEAGYITGHVLQVDGGLAM